MLCQGDTEGPEAREARWAVEFIRFVAGVNAGAAPVHLALHQRRPRIDYVHSSGKRCRSVKDRSRLWKGGRPRSA